MAKKIELSLEFGCYPIWLYNEHDEIVNTLLPEELRSDEELDVKFTNLQKRFEQLYYDKNGKFDPYDGVKWTEEEEQTFKRDWRVAVEELVAKTNAKYEGRTLPHSDIEEILENPCPYVIVDGTFARF